MSEFNRSDAYTAYGETLKDYIMRVFSRMGMGLALTAGTAYGCYRSLMTGGFMYTLLFRYDAFSFMFFGCAIVQIVLCLMLSMRLTKLRPATATGLFYGYAVITGITFSVLPLSFGEATVFGAFVFAAVLFGCCLVIGHTTTVDLSTYQGLLIGGLVGLLVTSLLSFFIPVFRDSLLINYIGIILFLALTAWDMQRLKSFYYQYGGTGDMEENIAVYGAFQLYLDFINIFLRVLRILASRNSRR